MHKQFIKLSVFSAHRTEHWRTLSNRARAKAARTLPTVGTGAKCNKAAPSSHVLTMSGVCAAFAPALCMRGARLDDTVTCFCRVRRNLYLSAAMLQRAGLQLRAVNVLRKCMVAWLQKRINMTYYVNIYVINCIARNRYH